MGILKGLRPDENAHPKEEQEALELYQQGLRYMEGQGVEKNVKEAVRLYHQAMGRWESARLDFEVGRCYALGIGVERDTKEAKRLLQRCSVEIPEAARLLMDIYREEKNPQIALYFASVALPSYPELAGEAEELASGVREGHLPPKESLDILRAHRLYAQENSVYHYVADLLASMTGLGVPNIDYVVNLELDLYRRNPLWLWEGKDQDFWVVLAMQFAEGSAEFHLEPSLELALTAAAVALASAYKPEDEMPRPRLLRKNAPPALDGPLRTIRSGDFSQTAVNALHSFADSGNYYATAELAFLADFVTSEQGSRQRREQQLREQGCPAFSGNCLLMAAAALEDADPISCQRLAMLLSGKEKGGPVLPNEMAAKLLAGVYLTLAGWIDAGLESVQGDWEAVYHLADIQAAVPDNRDNSLRQLMRCVRNGYAPAVLRVVPEYVYDRVLYGTSKYDGDTIPDPLPALNALPDNFFDKAAQIDGVKTALKKERQEAARQNAARRAQAERLVRESVEEKLDRSERRWNALFFGAPVTNETVFAAAALVGIDGAADGYALSEISRESTVSRAIKKKQRELAEDEYRKKLDRIENRPRSSGSLTVTCFTGAKQAGYWLTGTLAGRTLRMLGCLGGFDYDKENKVYLSLLANRASKKGFAIDGYYAMRALGRRGHKLAAYDAKEYRRAAAMWHEASMCEAYREDPDSEFGREMLRRACYVGSRDAKLEQAKLWLRLGQNLETAVQYLEEFAQEGNSDAQELLSVCYLNGYGVKKDPEEALRRMREEAEKGSAPACLKMGEFYEHGTVVERDAAQAMSWYEKAAEQELPAAILRLAQAYLEGDLVPKDFTKTLLYAVQGVLTKDEACINFYNSLGPEQAGDLRRYYSPKKWRKAPGLIRIPTPENLAYEKLRKDMQRSSEIMWSRHLVTAAQGGFVDAQYFLGDAYLRGRGVQRDPYMAFWWFEKSAEQGNLLAIEALTRFWNRSNDKGFYNVELARHYADFAKHWGSDQNFYWETAESRRPDPPEVAAAKDYQRGLESEQEGFFSNAFSSFTFAAQNGHAEAQFKVGWYAETGKNEGKKNQELAVQMYTRAAEQGHVEAMYRLGLCCREGRGTPRDSLAAERWLQEAANHGYADTLVDASIRCFNEKDYEQAARLAQAAADLGSTDAMALLGAFYFDGTGVVRDLEQGFLWCERSAREGNRVGQNQLAGAYEYGKGTEKDDSKAFCWYQKAAEQGEVRAMVHLASFYKTGRGTEENPEAAFQWYERAAQKGNAFAQVNVGICYCYGKGVEEDIGQAIQWYEKARAQGNADAICNLGWLFAEGKKVPKDTERALALFREAVDKGFPRGKYSLGRCLFEGIGVEKDEEAGLTLIREAAGKYQRAREYLEKKGLQ